MSKYIDADLLRKEVERRLVKYDADYTSAGSELKELLSFIASLQQEQPEVDLDKEAVMFCFDNGINITPNQAKEIARYFYELGKNARK